MEMPTEAERKHWDYYNRGNRLRQKKRMKTLLKKEKSCNFGGLFKLTAATTPRWKTNNRPTMRLLHTSDWHLGQRFYHYDRDDEHAFFIHQLISILHDEQPDALLVSGDIFDSAIPSVTAQHRFVSSILALHKALPTCTIIITAGNHDSGSRLDVQRELWDIAGIKVVGTCQRNADGTFCPDDFIVEVADKGFVAAVPYFHSSNYPLATPDTDRTQRPSAFYKKLLDEIEKRNQRALPVAVMAHLAVDGCDIRGHENQIIGGMDKAEISLFGSGYDYLALGHIHKPQQINSRVRYSGSPIPLSFTENYSHSVSLVEISAHGAIPTIRSDGNLLIKPLRNVKTLQTDSLEGAFAELRNLNDTDHSYLRILIDQEKLLPTDTEQRALQLVSNKACRLCEVHRVLRQRNDIEDNSLTNAELLTAHSISPLEIAKHYYERTHQAPMPSELAKMMSSVIDLAISQQNTAE